ncbi:chorismate mutase [Bifidobacterium sp. B4081]|uniref:prephenate dehydratase domain-containing protein n=1 Tax=unclassified Bifidobacterium TaxID=2608897 RepID=UPI00226A8AA8|nr:MULTISPECIES: prephenate dehydratase domain-containing protein [unclassified Bifidobacterium]MCX8643899.1 chorismate mutase [Bifidobacterium sp. B4077]MCX8646081.1 chorismate mutase [Bifidobacterium sp. B4081]MCX8669252.1 chorismate mutase [Bifidobacterium sp. B3998]
MSQDSSGKPATVPDRVSLYFLGPEGTFTHQAALEAANLMATGLDCKADLRPCLDAAGIVVAVEEGRGWGVLAWENNVEGHVVPNMDALIDAQAVAGFGMVRLPIVFDAFVRADHGPLDQVAAHPHGLAQCKGFIKETGLNPVTANSNAAACRDLGPNQVALGPRICGSLYGLETYRREVQDYQGARTDFLLLAPRDQAARLARRLAPGGDFESIVTFIPLNTGPGVLANLLDRLRDAGLNMTSFMSRPIKGHDGTYSFVASIDAAPWQKGLHQVLADLLDKGDWLKTLAVHPRTPHPAPPIREWMLPRAGAFRGEDPDSETISKELLW